MDNKHVWDMSTGGKAIGEFIKNLTMEAKQDLMNALVDSYECDEIEKYPDYKDRPKVVRISWLIDPYENHNSLAETSSNVFSMSKSGLTHIIGEEGDNLYFASEPISMETIYQSLAYFGKHDWDRPGQFYATKDGKYKIYIDL